MSEVDIVPVNYLRYGLSRKKEFLKDVRNAYDGLVLPANILLYQYKSTPSVIHLTKKPFFVDPMSYLFGQEFVHFKKRVDKTNSFLYKPSFARLMEGHGLDPKYFIDVDYQLLLNMLYESSEKLRDFVNKCLEFQWNNVYKSMYESRELVSEEEQNEFETDLYRPKFLIPPYFEYENDADSLTSKLNIKILEYCCSIDVREKYSVPIFPMVFLQKGELNSSFIQSVVLQIQTFGFQGHCVWIGGFDERYISEQEAKHFLELVQSLSLNNKKVVDLYGGYFSLTASKFGLTHVCHGLTVGESRGSDDSAKTISGPVPVRYYIMGLHRLLLVEDAVRILRVRKDLMCDCQVCSRLVKGNPENVALFATEEELTEMHFLLNRYYEKNSVAASSLSQLIEELDFLLVNNSDIDSITKPYLRNKVTEHRSILDKEYLNIWKTALEFMQAQNTSS
jgi:hypothetical protein